MYECITFITHQAILKAFFGASHVTRSVCEVVELYLHQMTRMSQTYGADLGNQKVCVFA